MKPTDDELIAEYLNTKGAQRCPAKTAAVLGETTPGWRRDAERRAEASMKPKIIRKHQRQLRSRFGGGARG